MNPNYLPIILLHNNIESAWLSFIIFSKSYNKDIYNDTEILHSSTYCSVTALPQELRYFFVFPFFYSQQLLLKCQQIISTIQHQYFKVQQNIQSIFIYTSDLTCYDQSTKTNINIFDKINTFRRTDNILNKSQSQIQTQLYRKIYFQNQKIFILLDNMKHDINFKYFINLARLLQQQNKVQHMNTNQQQTNNTYNKKYKKWMPHMDIDITIIPAELSYIFVYPCSYKQIYQQNNIKNIPILLTYKNQETTLQSLFDRYVSLCPEKQIIGSQFCLERDNFINMQSTLKNLRHSLRRDQISGLVLYTKQKPKQQSFSAISDQSYDDQIGLKDYLYYASQFDKLSTYELNFKLPGNHNYLSLTFRNNLTIPDMVQKLIQQIKGQFGVKLTPQNIDKLTVVATAQVIYLNEGKYTTIGQFQNRSIFQLTIVGSSQEFDRIKYKQKQDLHILYRNKHISVLDFNKIAFMSWDLVYCTFIKKQVKVQNALCLKIADIFIRPHDSMHKLCYLFNKRQNTEIKVVGSLITQKMLFEDFMLWLIQSQKIKPFSLKELPAPLLQPSDRQTCQRKIKQRTKIVTNQYFKRQQNISIIYFYTSDIDYTNQKTNVKMKLYSAINTRLRMDNFLTQNIQDIWKEWEYCFSSTLIYHLQKIKKTQCQVYRGLIFDLDYKIKQKITLKAFTSTSINRNVAINFLMTKANQQTQNYPRNLLVMRVTSGKSIDDYSMYHKLQNQILLEPYRQFNITNIYSVMEKNPMNSKQQYLVKVYQMQEIEPQEVRLSSIVNYLVWIDQHAHESHTVFQHIVNFTQTLILVKCGSTDQLQNWIKIQKQNIKGTNVRILFITNMRRMEKQTMNDIAGIQAIKLIRKQFEKPNICLYIKDIQLANQKIDGNSISRQNLKIYSQIQEIIEEVEKYFNVKTDINGKKSQKKQEKQEKNKTSQSSSCTIQ